jgi:hypothetical protein
LVEKYEGKTPFERPRPRWKDNIKIDLGERKFKGNEWTSLAVSSEDGYEPWASRKSGKFLNYQSEYYLLKKGSPPCQSVSSL